MRHFSRHGEQPWIRSIQCLAGLLESVTVAGVVLLGVHLAAAQDLEPRKELPGERVEVIPFAGLDTTREEHPEYKLVIKFRDEHLARTMAGGEVTFDGTGAVVETRAVAHSYGVKFEPLFRTDPGVLESLLEKARVLSGREQPDLGGFLIAEIDWKTLRDLQEVGYAFLRLEEVESVEINLQVTSLPGNLYPPTPYLGASQTYRYTGPAGMDFDYARLNGARGSGVRLSDIEFNWLYTHEDLMNINLHPEPGQTPQPDVHRDRDHGAAVIGVAAAENDAYGIDGMVNQATFYTYPAWSEEASGGYRVPDAIANACNDSSPGDVVLIEQETYGKPVETRGPDWTATRVCVDAGIVVVAAAGNGGHDLEAISGYMARGDSGAILVGAGSADSFHDKLSLSNYACRVNVQSWGEHVYTLGRGSPNINDYHCYDGTLNQCYTPAFNGTSSAAALVATACVALQSNHQRNPLELRNHLIRTGIPQGAGGHIGPFVNLRRAIDGTFFDSIMWADFGQEAAIELGTFCEPFNTLSEATDAVESGGTVTIKGDSAVTTSHEAPLTLSKAMTVVAEGGSVVIAPLS